MSEKKVSNYFNGMIKAGIEQHKKNKKENNWSGIDMICILHDDWCDMLKDSSNRCNCNPEITKGIKE